MKKQTTLLFIFSLLLIGCATTKPALPKAGEYLLFDKHENFAFKTTSVHQTQQFFTLQDLQKQSHLYIDIIKSTNLTSKAFYSNEQTVLQKNCSTLSSHIYTEAENRLIWQQTCDNTLSNKSNFTIYKTIKSDNNFYVIKRRWVDTQPSKEVVEKWLEYLDEIQVYNNKL